MITSSREKDFQPKVEGDATNISKFTKAQSSSSSRQWSSILKNPRIVRVSRAFGGKDRHSKVCTVRGLRDRRIRLSVPTAIQLYDLQDRLGLNQPSQVVDWLLDATTHEIDKLPPLQMPPGNFSQFHQPNLASHHELNPPQSTFASLFSNKGGINKINYGLGDDQLMGNSRAWESGARNMGRKLKEVDDQRSTIDVEKTKWMRTNDQGQNHQDGSGGSYSHNVSAQNFFPIASNSSFPTPYNSNNNNNYYYHHWEPSNLSLSQFGSHGIYSQTEGANTSNLAAFPPPFLPPSGSQLFLGPPAVTPSIFAPYPSYVTNIPGENHTRHTNHFQLLNSSANPLINPSLHSFSSSPLNAASRVHLHSQNDERQPNKGNSTGS